MASCLHTQSKLRSVITLSLAMRTKDHSHLLRDLEFMK